MDTVLAVDGVGGLPVWRSEVQHPGTDRNDLSPVLFRQGECIFPRLDAESKAGS